MVEELVHVDSGNSRKLKMNTNTNNSEFWLQEKLTTKNMSEFFDFLLNTFNEHEIDLAILKKKMLKRNKATLSMLIMFTRKVDEKKYPVLKPLLRKAMQVIMDNPKSFRK